MILHTFKQTTKQKHRVVSTVYLVWKDGRRDGWAGLARNDRRMPGRKKYKYKWRFCTCTGEENKVVFLSLYCDDAISLWLLFVFTVWWRMRFPLAMILWCVIFPLLHMMCGWYSLEELRCMFTLKVLRWQRLRLRWRWRWHWAFVIIIIAV